MDNILSMESKLSKACSYCGVHSQKVYMKYKGRIDTEEQSTELFYCDGCVDNLYTYDHLIKFMRDRDCEHKNPKLINTINKELDRIGV